MGTADEENRRCAWRRRTYTDACGLGLTAAAGMGHNMRYTRGQSTAAASGVQSGEWIDPQREKQDGDFNEREGDA